MTRMKRGDYESQTADNQISLLVSRLRTRYSGWVCGQRSVVRGLSDFVSFVVFCKNLFARRGRRVYGYGKPQVRHGESVSPRRPDEERSRHFTMARKDAAPLARRRVD